MKDEEMAFDNWWKDYGKDRDSCEYVVAIYGFLEGLKAGRPQWHDLRKDPNDLPKEPKQYLCQIECCVGSAIVYECSDYDVEYNSWRDSYGDVIAWCEIPTFDKE